MAGRILDYKGAEEYTGLSYDQLRGLVYRRQIPFMKIGKSVKFDVRHLDRWIEQSHQAAS